MPQVLLAIPKRVHGYCRRDAVSRPRLHCESFPSSRNPTQGQNCCSRSFRALQPSRFFRIQKLTQHKELGGYQREAVGGDRELSKNPVGESGSRRLLLPQSRGLPLAQREKSMHGRNAFLQIVSSRVERDLGVFQMHVLCVSIPRAGGSFSEQSRHDPMAHRAEESAGLLHPSGVSFYGLAPSNVNNKSVPTGRKRKKTCFSLSLFF